MKFVVLGSGTSVPHAERSSSAYWLETRGGSLLLDCSASAIHRMAQENLDWANLDAIWISHFHLDHVGGLAPFLFGTKWAPETQVRTKTLTIFGPKGIENLVNAFDKANDYGLLEQPFPVEIVEVEPYEKFQILSDAAAAVIPTPHTKESCAIRLEDEAGRSVVFSADTGYSRDLAAFAKKVDLFVLECSFVKNKPVEKHLELAEAVALIERAKPKRAMLSHLYPEWDEVNFDSEIAKLTPSVEIIKGFDGLCIDLFE